MTSLASWSFNQRLNFGCEWNSFSHTVGGTFMGIQWDKNGIYPLRTFDGGLLANFGTGGVFFAGKIIGHELWSMIPTLEDSPNVPIFWRTKGMEH